MPTPYEHRLELATQAIEILFENRDEAEEVAAAVLHAVDTIPEKLR